MMTSPVTADEDMTTSVLPGSQLPWHAGAKQASTQVRSGGLPGAIPASGPGQRSWLALASQYDL